MPVIEYNNQKYVHNYINAHGETVPNEDELTSTFMSVVHSTDRFRGVFSTFYRHLIKALWREPITSDAMSNKDMFVVFKGPNCLHFLGLKPRFTAFNYTVFIDPNLAPDVFERIKCKVHEIVCAHVSSHKAYLDQVFGFYPSRKYEPFTEFMEQVAACMPEDVDTPFYPQGTSRAFNVKSVVYYKELSTGRDVRMEVPHFECGHTYALRTSPLMCSVNTNTSNSFDILRMRLGAKKAGKRSMINLYDVVILHQKSPELSLFWTNKDLEIQYDDIMGDKILVMSVDMYTREVTRRLDDQNDKLDTVSRERLQDVLGHLQSIHVQ